MIYTIETEMGYERGSQSSDGFCDCLRCNTIAQPYDLNRDVVDFAFAPCAKVFYGAPNSHFNIVARSLHPQTSDGTIIV